MRRALQQRCYDLIIGEKVLLWSGGKAFSVSSTRADALALAAILLAARFMGVGCRRQVVPRSEENPKGWNLGVKINCDRSPGEGYLGQGTM
ncbi:MAG: hypothetical protein LBT01_02475, partial [Spirochaetaceae bacterium]|nr:hypothetical protein [Spirochaetaceae bacterium]